MAKKLKVGIYGGTFSPPHRAHVKAAESFFEVVKPDKLMIIPDFLPPHKEIDGFVTAEDRLLMCRLAFGHIKNSEISDMEIQRGGRSYTYETLEELYSPDKELYFLCGTDMFLTLDSWRNPERIFELATISYVRRESDPELTVQIEKKKEFYKQKFGAKILEINTEAIELSSAQVRKELKDEKNARELLPEGVFQYISERGLYRDNQ